jgi:hypothetical protein
MALASCWLWAAFTPAILAFARRIRIDRTNWPRTLPVHLAAAAAATFLDVWLMHAIAPFVSPDAPTDARPFTSSSCGSCSCTRSATS